VSPRWKLSSTSARTSPRAKEARGDSHEPPKDPESSYAELQGFTVAARCPRSSAVAAINESIAGKGLPVRVACARSEAHRAATRQFTGSTRPENQASRSRASHSSSCAGRPVFSRHCLTPASGPPQVEIGFVRDRLPSGRAWNQELARPPYRLSPPWAAPPLPYGRGSVSICKYALAVLSRANALPWATE
jgi:hypothetical protein